MGGLEGSRSGLPGAPRGLALRRGVQQFPLLARRASMRYNGWMGLLRLLGSSGGGG